MTPTPTSPREEELKLRENSPKNHLLYICGQDNKELGYLKEENDQLTFHGKADEAAQVFFDAVIEKYNLRINELKQERAATEERVREKLVQTDERFREQNYSAEEYRANFMSEVLLSIKEALRGMKEEK